ncbi:hypothetical protein O7600_20190 [Micromonospora sp. WMMA1998]|uniref:hypothetical protein n=1 Tax=Micromonospora sp. WMMA1998 TaxID=3015167 RepID=UPI00248ADE57|nr:hypothetical protein [Micromonospora sp. WMMA1998]WBC13452.1 hypothetical protein O7600_20190 [Micromonospora sp. WMMA1998]
MNSVFGHLGGLWIRRGGHRLVTRPARDQGRGSLTRRLPDTDEEMRVRVGRDRDGRMAERLGDDAHLYPGGETQRRSAVPEVVKPYPAHAGRLHQLGESLRDGGGRHQRVAVFVSEDQAVVDVRLAPLVPLGVLSGLVRGQHRHRALV